MKNITMVGGEPVSPCFLCQIFKSCGHSYSLFMCTHNDDDIGTMGTLLKLKLNLFTVTAMTTSAASFSSN